MAGAERLICRAASLAEGGRGVRFEVEREGQARPAFAIRYGGRVYAYLNQCAHAGTELDLLEGEFFDRAGVYLICATHGALFAPDSGRCLGGPCQGRALQALAVEERDGEVFLRD